MMRTGFVVLAAVIAVSTSACVPKNRPAAPARAVAATARPFDAMPSVALADNQQAGPMYRVQIVAEITRDVMPTDDLAIVVSVGGDHEIGRYPIVGRFEHKTTRIKQEIELPLGDYEIEYDYRGTRYTGMPFRVAEVPVWGGHRALQLRTHPGTRVSLREKKLWLGRWWANDGPPRAWIIEWVYEGQVVTTTSGREDRGIPSDASRIVGGAAGAFASSKILDNTIWTYGEEYPIPDVIATKPGPWAARVVHGGSSPVAVVFTVLPGGRLGEASTHRVRAVGWQESWSKRLEQRSLSVTEVERLTAKLPQLNSNQPFDDVPADSTSSGPESPIRISTAAVRALFRSKDLAEAWWKFSNLNVTPPAAAMVAPSRPVDAAAFPKAGGGAKRPGMPAPREASANAGKTPAQAAKDEADRKAKVRALRGQIESLIKQHGGPWKSDEFPRS